MQLDHVRFGVADLERSLDWYSRLLGVDATEGSSFELPGGGRLTLERRPDSATSVDNETFEVGNAHLCFTVDDLHSEYERLRGHASFRSPAPVALAVGANAGGWGVYLRDPDGITVELLQLPTR
jgi:lactoylglutathione lyase